MVIEFMPKGVCSRRMRIDVDQALRYLGAAGARGQTRADMEAAASEILAMLAARREVSA